MEPQGQARVATRLQVAPRLLAVECPALEKDVGCLGDPRRLGQDLREREVEVRVGVVEFRRHGMRAQPGRNPAPGLDRPERRELRLAVETVARLGLERRRAGVEHPVAMPANGFAEPVLAGVPRRLDRGQDASARGVQLLVARSARAQLELTGAIAGEARVRVAVDEPGERAQAPPVELLHVACERAEVGHPPHVGDAAVLAQDIRVLDDVDPPEVGAAQRRFGSRRRYDLAEVAHEQARRSVRRAHSASVGGIGGSRPWSAAASAASS